jgi:lipoprotein-anchoring transpeptidase ErfK/SrfK
MAKRELWFLIFSIIAFVWAPHAIGQMVTVPNDRCRISFPSDARIAWTCAQAKNETTFIEWLGPRSAEDVLRFNRIDRLHAFRGAYLKIPVELDTIAHFAPMPQKLDQAKGYPRYIFVDRAEQFLGAYEFGELQFSFPVSSGKNHATPAGVFKVLARDERHRSFRYPIPGTNIPYPMWWGIKFGNALWIHSHDLPGYPMSHGCVGLYDEEMQRKFYHYPSDPQLMDAERLYFWIFPDAKQDHRRREYQGGLEGIRIEIR